MARRRGAPKLSPEELERMRNDPGRVYRDTFRPAPGRSVTPIPEGVVIPPAGSGRNFSSNPASIRPSSSKPKRPGRPGINFEIGGGLVGSRFPGFTQPGGGPGDFGGPGDVRNASRKAKTVNRLSGKYAWLAGRLRAPKTEVTESANVSPESFEALQKALSDANQKIQDLQNQENSTTATPVEEEIIERKIKGYLGERPIYEDERIDFTGTGWEIL